MSSDAVVQIRFLKKVHEGGDVFSFVFQKPAKFIWTAGQFARVSFDEGFSDSLSRTFTIASHVSEGVVMFSTRVGEDASDFKKRLMDLEIGGGFFLKGPFGSFFVNSDESRVVGVAGGIGVTPFRAMVIDIAGRNGLDFRLIYSAKDFVFSKMFDENGLNVDYVSGRDDMFLKLGELVGSDVLFMISGAPKMIEGVKDFLLEKGVDQGRIRFDPFYGY